MQKQYEYLLIGSGRLAKHLSVYFDSLSINYLKWNRSDKKSIKPLLSQSSKVLLAISDNAIEPFISSKLKKLDSKTIIHFSGCLSIAGVQSAHPLMTFSNKFYPLSFYKTIPFITEKGKTLFRELFPKLPNPNYQIEPELKPYYHAWCAIAGNFTTILWNNFEERLEEKFNIPKEAMIPYLQKTTANIINSKQSLTGPFARKDFSTIKKHKDALKEDRLSKIYDEFYSLYFNINN